MASTSKKRQLVLFVLFLIFLPLPSHGDTENRPGFSLSRSDTAPLTIKLYKEIISGHSGSVSVNPIRADIELEGSCPQGYQFIKLRLLGSDDNYFGGHSRDIPVHHPKRTARVQIHDIDYIFNVNLLRRTCSERYNGNGTFIDGSIRYFKVTCAKYGAPGYDEQHSIHNVTIPLKVTCEDVLSPNEYRAKVSAGEVEYKCPQLNAAQPQSGEYYDNYRIVVSGTPYGHFISKRLENENKLKCIRVKANDGQNLHGNSYYTPVGTQ